MTQQYNIDREFIKWFYEEQYPEQGSNRRQVYAMGNVANIDVVDYWMREAFKQGARSISNETRCILSDWACAVEGLDPELTTPSQVFDRAELNLDLYYKRVFGDKHES